jgi:hypothetical protein
MFYFGNYLSYSLVILAFRMSTLDLVFFEKIFEFFGRFCFSNFSKMAPKNSKNLKKNYLIFDTIWLQFG